MKPETARQLYDAARQKFAESTAESLLKLLKDHSGAISTAGGAGLGALGGYLASRDNDWAERNPRAYRRAMMHNIISGSIIGGGTGALAHGLYNAGQLANDVQKTPPLEEEFRPNNAPEEVAFVARDRHGEPLSLGRAGARTTTALASLLGMKGLSKLLKASKPAQGSPGSVDYKRLGLSGGKATAALLALLNGREATDILGATYAPSWLDIPIANAALSPVLPHWARAARQYARGPRDDE
jgi:hypothetical protein